MLRDPVLFVGGVFPPPLDGLGRVDEGHDQVLDAKLIFGHSKIVEPPEPACGGMLLYTAAAPLAVPSFTAASAMRENYCQKSHFGIRNDIKNGGNCFYRIVLLSLHFLE